MTTDKSILEEAQGLIHGSRNKDYGHPLDNFTMMGRMWGALLGVPDIPAETVAVMMVSLPRIWMVTKPSMKQKAFRKS
jgi:hypothetical protein